MEGFPEGSGMLDLGIVSGTESLLAWLLYTAFEDCGIQMKIQ